MKTHEIRNLSTKEICDAEVVHSHGQHLPHIHTEDEYVAHQQPIDNEDLIKRRYA